MDDTILAAADTIRAQIQEKVDQVKSDPAMAEIVNLQSALNGLEAILGRPQSTLAQFFGLDRSVGGTPVGPAIAPDEFVNLPALDAAKKFLRKVGRPARPFAEIVRGVRAGGGVVNYEDKFKTQMIRSNDVKKVGEDLFGLAEWYPARKGRPPSDGGGKTRTTINTPEGEVEISDDDVDAGTENASPATNE